MAATRSHGSHDSPGSDGRAALRDRPLSAWELFRIWASIGVQSLGGGAATTLLVQRAFIDRYRVVSEEEFARLYAQSVMTPGTSLVAMAVLLGRRERGAWGMILSLVGFLLPSGALTCAMAALLSRLTNANGIEAAMRGVVPATGGVMLVVAINFLRPLVQASARISSRRLLISGGVVLLGLAAVVVAHASPAAVVVVAAAIGAWVFAPQRTTPDPSDQRQGVVRVEDERLWVGGADDEPGH